VGKDTRSNVSAARTLYVVLRSYIEDQQIDTAFSLNITQEQFDTLKFNALAMINVPRLNMRTLTYYSIFPRILRGDDTKVTAKQLESARNDRK